MPYCATNILAQQLRLRPFAFWYAAAFVLRKLLRIQIDKALNVSSELQEGFTSSLANNQVLFMVLDGVMMIFTVFVLSVAHPGSVFGYRWHQGAFRWRRNNEKEMLSTSTSNAPADTTAE